VRPAPGVVRAPGRTRFAAVFAMLLAAPVMAELLQAYLDNTGDVLEVVFVIVFLAPLYGGAGLLIREIALRTGRGWRGVLLLATAFGVAMPTLVDLSLFTPHNPDYDYWDDIMGAATVGGISVYAVTSWVMGHVVMSIGAPLVVVDGVFPDARAKSWLGRTGSAVVAVLGVLVAWAIHSDNDLVVHTSTTRYVVSAATVGALVVLAMTPWGRPLTPVAGRRPGRPWLLGLAGFMLMATFDFAPTSWLGVGIACTALVAAGALVVVRSRSPEWSWRHLVAFAFGGILARTLTGFLAPVPAGVTTQAKVAQNLVFLLLVLALGALLRVRTREPRQNETR